MKNIFLKLSIFAIFSFTLLSCLSEDDNISPLEENSNLVLLNSGITSVTLTDSLATQQAIQFVWNDNTNLGGDYEVVMSPNQDFEPMFTLGSTSETQFAMNVAEFNNALIQAGITPYSGQNIFVRIMKAGQYSNDISFSVNAYPVDGPVIISPSNNSNLSLTEPTSAEEITLDWSDYEFAEVTYNIWAALADTDFENPQLISSVQNQTEITWTQQQLNTVVQGLGLEAGSEGSIEIIVESVTQSATGPISLMSESIILNITPYVSDYPSLYLVGEAVAAGWNPNNNNQILFQDPNDTSIYYFTGYFNAGAFKLIEVIGEWQPQWGTNDGQTLAVNDGSGSDPDVFNIPSAGFYTFMADVSGNSGTFTITPYDASTATTYSTIGIIGDATADGWNSDQDMMQSSFDPHQWYIMDVTLIDGEMKFRAENGWDINWGSNTALYGQGTLGGDNIPVDAGTYDIWFNDLDGRYILIPQE